jgi:uncharacterized protein YjlB
MPFELHVFIMEKSSTLRKPEHYIIHGDVNFPNNDMLPVLVYRHVFDATGRQIADIIEQTFNKNKWTNSWRNGILRQHHYHSNTHEALGISSGQCKIQLGGPTGIILDVEKGDVVILPAGIAHKNLGCSDHFECIGGYPEGIEYDLKYGKPEERPEADDNIRKVPLPETDPVYGYDGALITFWLMQ